MLPVPQRFAALAVCAFPLVAVTSCGNSAAPIAEPRPAITTPAAATEQTTNKTVDAAGGQARTDARTTTDSGMADVEPAAGDTTTTTRPSQTDRIGGLRGSSPYVWRINASVSPSCVRAGGTATVTVVTAPRAAVGYVAEYAGRKSGAAPPFGYGYGGNAGGYTDQSGGWTQTWTIRADAPIGPANVIVAVASHQTHKQVNAPFTVVDPVTGQC